MWWALADASKGKAGSTTVSWPPTADLDLSHLKLALRSIIYCFFGGCTGLPVAAGFTSIDRAFIWY
jgi:hypothetical protein